MSAVAEWHCNGYEKVNRLRPGPRLFHPITLYYKKIPISLYKMIFQKFHERTGTSKESIWQNELE